MSDGADKPFEATPRRIAKARREGNVARAAELSANVSFVAACLAVVATTPALAAVAAGLLRDAIGGEPASWRVVLIVAQALVPVGAAATAGAAASIVQNGGLLVTPIAPKADRLNPATGLRRILSRETLGHTARAGLAFALAGAVMAPAIAWCAAALLRETVPSDVAGIAWKAVQEVAAAAAGVGSVFSIAEYGTARSAWLRKLRMSFEERKRETREEEGDAAARGRRRSMHRSLLQGAVSRVKEAAFVVVNPTHLAVALRYEPPAVAVPTVLVLAAGDAARRVRELADGYGIPIVEDALLARSLFRDGRSGAAIPAAYYVAVAAIVVGLLRRNEIPR